MRQATIEENCNSSLNSVIQRCDNRMFFARQGSVSQANFMRQATTEPPKFAGPGRRTSGRIEWSPRMDVAESGCSYVVTVEIPSVNCHDIRVEIDDQKLTVQGRRSTQYWKLSSFSNDSISAYHKQEILQGPYQVVWPLPANVNKDSVSAEFL
ncbi:hypothetical protein RGQ29_009583 [Quercus rubra]|uniref:SHSP domain-containing protein n=1 Tax=Quercus rubra TaxID=3512 RepID=A0AAN7FY84_QUERU|nr:hypothetical protein RGQ29_009583 [Quercus rubra]